MNDFQMMIEFEQQLREKERCFRDEQFRQDALAANRHRTRLNLMWLRKILHQTQLPKITSARPMSTVKNQR